MFEPTEFIEGPRAGQSIEHAESPGQLEFPDGRYLMMKERLTDEEFLAKKGGPKIWYQWHPRKQS